MSGVPNGTTSTAVISRPSCGRISSQLARWSSQYGPGPVSTAYFVCGSCGSMQAMLAPCTRESAGSSKVQGLTDGSVSAASPELENETIPASLMKGATACMPIDCG